MEESKPKHGGYTIVCVDPLDLALQQTIGIFETQEDAVFYAENDRGCQKDWHWTIVANEKPEEEESGIEVAQAREGIIDES